MNNVDPDVLAVLKTVVSGEESNRVQAIRAKHDKQLAAKLETEMQLLSDEVSKIIPVTHPLFESVLMLTVLRKAARSQEEPEFKSFLEEDFPQGW